MNQAISEGDDCGLDGENGDTVTVGKMNRLIRRIHNGHIKPLHAGVAKHDEWIERAEIMVAKFEGGIAVARRLAYIMSGTVVLTFGLTLYMFREFERLMK